MMQRLVRLVRIYSILIQERKDGECMPTIGEKIREVRTKRGLTQGDLSAGLVTASMISQIEADRAKPSYALLTSLANRLGMPVEYFMNDMDEQFTISACLGIANYYALTDQADKALDTLSKIPAQEPFGSYYQEFQFLKARCFRLLQSFYDAVSCLEQLREVAYRTQDPYLQFKVCKESGYVEYDLKNYEGAMHEWKKAIDLGTFIIESGITTSVFMNAEMLDIFIQMDCININKLSNDNQNVYLQEAALLSKRFANFRSIGESLIEEAKNLLNIDVSKSKSLADRAVSLLESARLVEEYIFIHVKLRSPENTSSIDPVTHAALATASISPITFIEAECERIEDLMSKDDFTAAERRIERCLDILDDYGREVSYTPSIRDMELKLNLYKAKVLKEFEGVHEGIKFLESLTGRLDGKLQPKLLIQIWAQLILWYGTIEDNESVFRLTRMTEDLVFRLKDHQSA